MPFHSRGRLASACALAILSAPAFAAGTGSPAIEAVVVMDDLDAIAIVGRNLPTTQRDLSVQLGAAGEPGDISAFCRVASPLSEALTCRVPGGLPPAGDYLLRVTHKRAGATAEYALTIGAIGPAGPAGPQGATGPAGAAGPQGVAGAIGPAGPVGPQGETGIAGPVGPVGPAGPAGAQGAMGPTGAAGPLGEPGIAGPVGPAGPAGAQGATGPTGAAGPQGEPGIAGPAGAQGATGPAGPMGIAGPQGLAGIAGTTGPVGPAGPMGPAGPEGAPGNSLLAQHYGNNTGIARANNGAECTMGTIQLTAADRGPGIPAIGQSLSIPQHQALFSLLGTTYGGDGVTTFMLPDLRPVAPNNMTYMICDMGIFPGER